MTASLNLRPGTTMYRIAELERVTAELREHLDAALGRLDMLDRLRPTCTRCYDAAATRQTAAGPACDECAGVIPDWLADAEREAWGGHGPSASYTQWLAEGRSGEVPS